MGNPHPTRSKPNKIGRKHTGEKSAREKQKRAAGLRKFKQIQKVTRSRKVRDYWTGKRDSHP